MQAITSAANYLNGKYLKGCSLYVTLEPCNMCAGAIYWSQLDRIIYSTSDLKRGYTLKGSILHPKTRVEIGSFNQESKNLLQDFFKNKRK